jgi:hypothetical protein
MEIIVSDHIGGKILEVAGYLDEVLKKGVDESGRWIFLQEVTPDEIDAFPVQLKMAKYDEVYPSPSYYVGYSIDPHTRFDVHSSGTSFSIKLNIAPMTICGLNHVINIITRKFDDLDVETWNGG